MYGATVGRLGILGIEATTNQAVCHLIPNNDRVDRDYLYYALSAQVKSIIAKGVGGAQPNISQGIVKSLKIPLPPLPEQRRIAKILDQSDALLAKRKRALALLDELEQSLFLEMFGDPILNEKGWGVVELQDIIYKIDSGKSPKCHARPAEPDEWGVLKLGAVTWGRYNATKNKALPMGTHYESANEVREGDVLFTRKNTRDLVGACAVVRETRNKLLIPDLIFRLILKNDKTNGEYLAALLMHPGQRERIQDLAGGSAGSMPNISKGRLARAKIPLPPVELQFKFASQIAAIERQRQLLSDCLEHANTFQASIQFHLFSRGSV